MKGRLLRKLLPLQMGCTQSARSASSRLALSACRSVATATQRSVHTNNRQIQTHTKGHANAIVAQSALSHRNSQCCHDNGSPQSTNVSQHTSNLETGTLSLNKRRFFQGQPAFFWSRSSSWPPLAEGRFDVKSTWFRSLTKFTLGSVKSAIHTLLPRLHQPVQFEGLLRSQSTFSGTSSCRPYTTTATASKQTVRGIQKDISPLTTKRLVPRKKSKESLPREQEYFDVAAYAVAEEFSMETVREDLGTQGLYEIIQLPDDTEDALHVEAKYRVDGDAREIFFFREGTVVFWNMPPVEREAVLELLSVHYKDGYDSQLVEDEFEYMEYTYNNGPSNLVRGEIHLHKSSEGNEKKNQLEKYAFSNALAQSVKLSIWEASLERFVDSIEFVIQDMKDGKKFKISRDEVLRKTGELFTLKHLINLSSDLLDEPDFYWDRESLVGLYSKTIAYLNIGKRTKVMNMKLDHCLQLTELLKDHLNDKHHTRLEVMIILLIAVEVVMGLFSQAADSLGSRGHHDT